MQAGRRSRSSPTSISTTSARIEAAKAGAACLRINPGNIGSAERVREVIQAAKDHGCSMRIGVNAGSLERDLLEKYGEPCPEAMVESALDHARILEDHDFHEFKISVKASDVFLAVAAYQQLAEASDYPLHLGITEAGGLRTGTVKSSIGMGIAAVGRHRRHHPRLAVRRSGRGDQGRLRHPEVAGPAPSRRQHHLLPVLRAAGLRRHQDGRGAGGAAGAHLHADDRCRSSAASSTARARRARPTSASPAAATTRIRSMSAACADHRLKDADIVDHLVELVEKKAAEIEAAKAQQTDAA